MTNIAFRISLPFSEVNLTELYDLCDKVAIYEHPADASVERTHIHGLLIGCKRKEDTIRNKFFKDKYEYSLKTTYKNKSGKTYKVDEHFMAYMSKGIYDASYIIGITEIEADYYKSLWAPPQEKVLVAINGHLYAKEPEPILHKKKFTKSELIADMMFKYRPHMDVEEVLTVVRESLIAHNEVLGRWKCIDFYDALLMYADADRWMDGIAYQINKRDRKN